ncbi:hypothetical protein B0H14DRAFT_3424577 [Mycena olivaceomarginata]|nr:hypothetical protein B0H14DRAFT_3424577 [Mycena olivaceomarginata]
MSLRVVWPVLRDVLGPDFALIGVMVRESGRVGPDPTLLCLGRSPRARGIALPLNGDGQYHSLAGLCRPLALGVLPPSNSNSSPSAPPDVLVYYNTAKPAAHRAASACPRSAAECGWLHERDGARAGGGSGTAEGDEPGPRWTKSRQWALLGAEVSALLSPHSPASAGSIASPMSPGAGLQRGRAAPFPMQPVSGNRPDAEAGAAEGPGLASRVKVQRHRDLNAIQIPSRRRKRPSVACAVCI